MFVTGGSFPYAWAEQDKTTSRFLDDPPPDVPAASARENALNNQNMLSAMSLFKWMSATVDKDVAQTLRCAGMDAGRSAQEWTHLAGRWTAFKQEPGGPEFLNFMDKLQKKNINDTNTLFQAQKKTWLSKLTQDDELRRKTFMEAYDNAADCTDHSILTYNRLQRIKIVHDVENKVYDNDLTKLITLARVQFRLDELNKIAHEKIKTLGKVDEIQVYLDYQTNLHERLNLPSEILSNTRYVEPAVTDDDLVMTEYRVKMAESERFADYLAHEWTPWDAVVQRLEPRLWQASRMRLMNKLESFDSDLDAVIKKRMGEDIDVQDPDIRREMGAELSQKYHRINSRALLHIFTEKHGLTGAMSSPWE